MPSSKAYLGAFSSLARTGKALNDPAFAAASKVFIASTDSIFSTSSSASAKAFISQTLGSSSSRFDTACASAATAYIEAFAAGSNSKAYAGKSPIVSKTNTAAMVAYMNSAIAATPSTLCAPPSTWSSLMPRSPNRLTRSP